MALASRIWAILDDIEERHAPLLSRVLAMGMADYARRMESETIGVDLAPEFRNEMVKAMSGVWWETGSAVYYAMLDEFKGGWAPEAKNEAEMTRMIRKYIDDYGGKKAAQVLTTSQKQVRNLIRGGMAQGEAADTVFGSVIQRIPNLATSRGLLITRTEAHSASQYASQLMAERSTIPLTKVWNSIKDNRIRDFGLSGRISNFNHRIMNGQEVAIMETFKVPTITGGFESLQFPGDPGGSAGNVINCRCIQTYRKMD